MHISHKEEKARWSTPKVEEMEKIIAVKKSDEVLMSRTSSLSDISRTEQEIADDDLTLLQEFPR